MLSSPGRMLRVPALGILSSTATESEGWESGTALGSALPSGGCLLLPSSARAHPQEQMLGLCVAASPGSIHLGTAGSPCAAPPPPSLPPPAGCHPPSGSRAVQLSCDFAWARNVGPQLFWSRVGVVLSLARHPATPLTAACLKEVGILCSSCRMCHCRTCHRADGTRACVSRSGFCLFSCVRCCMGREKPEPLQTEGEGGGGSYSRGAEISMSSIGCVRGAVSYGHAVQNPGSTLGIVPGGP